MVNPISKHTVTEAVLEVTAAAPKPELQVTPEGYTIYSGETVQCTAILMYPDGTTEDVTGQAEWFSSDIGVASISGGLATGMSAGETAITAVLGDLTSNQALLTVTAPTPTPVPLLQVTAENDTIDIGETVQCTATLMYPDGTTEDVTGQVEWCCADPDVASLDAGLVTGESAGATEITATLDGVMSNAVALTVTAPAPLLLLTAESDTIDIGETVQCTAVLTYPDGTTEDVTGQVEWCCADTDVASVDTGLVTGESAGATEITATYDGVMSNAVALTVTETAAALQWWSILAIVCGVLAAGLVVYQFAIRKRAIKQE